MPGASNPPDRRQLTWPATRASDEEVIATGRAVAAPEFTIALPEGYDTHLGERGGTLSAGERLVALARAALVDPQRLILDEATARVDTRTEARIQAELEQLAAGGRYAALYERQFGALQRYRTAASWPVASGGRWGADREAVSCRLGRWLPIR